MDVTGGEGKGDVDVEAAVCTDPTGRTRMPCVGTLAVAATAPVSAVGALPAAAAPLPVAVAVPFPGPVLPFAPAAVLAPGVALPPALAPCALADGSAG
ncbi:MAG: hypothetical protein QOI41_2658, partial [Myxococcales bacterium]|nr:hypothetical protein [Myxococcales bacterium]